MADDFRKRADRRWWKHTISSLQKHHAVDHRTIATIMGHVAVAGWAKICIQLIRIGSVGITLPATEPRMCRGCVLRSEAFRVLNRVIERVIEAAGEGPAFVGPPMRSPVT